VERVRPRARPAELKGERESQRNDEIREIDSREVLGEVGDRVPESVELGAEVERCRDAHHRSRLVPVS
jgi:hypothetical protein